MTNEELRRKSGRDMEFNRQQSGRDMEFNRQQSGRNMEEARRASGRKMRDDMNSLAERNRPSKSLPDIPVRGPVAARRGNAPWGGATPSSSGISGDLSETAGTRQKYPTSVIIPDGGFFAYLVSPIKQMEFSSGGDTVKVNLQPPDYTLVEPVFLRSSHARSL